MRKEEYFVIAKTHTGLHKVIANIFKEKSDIKVIVDRRRTPRELNHDQARSY